MPQVTISLAAHQHVLGLEVRSCGPPLQASHRKFIYVALVHVEGLLPRLGVVDSYATVTIPGCQVVVVRTVRLGVDFFCAFLFKFSELRNFLHSSRYAMLNGEAFHLVLSF